MKIKIVFSPTANVDSNPGFAAHHDLEVFNKLSLRHYNTMTVPSLSISSNKHDDLSRKNYQELCFLLLTNWSGKRRATISIVPNGEVVVKPRHEYYSSSSM